MSRHTKAGRNDRCACGSGKKSKHCCQAANARKDWRSRALLGLVLVAIAGAVIAGVMSLTDDASAAGPAPGQVWSQEHGHYH